MSRKRLWAAALPCLILPLAFLAPGGASAQSSGGLPPWLTIGTPRGISNRVDTGQANYPGSNGFVPGYGYYPDWNQNRWVPEDILYGHSAPDPRGRYASSGAAVLQVAPDVPPAAALLRVRLPADAELWFSGAKTTQRGDSRLFVTPEIAKGGSFLYEIHARWMLDGKQVERVKKVRVNEGDRITVDFLRAENEPDVLPPPRKLP
jgi:uncharacterized protein (TIGR03000 family)